MVANYRKIAEQLTNELGLTMPPVQITYLEERPSGIPEHPGGVPSVCTFFAYGTRSPFYAGLPKHEDCEIGAFVLGIPPQGPAGARLMDTIGTMQRERYLNPGEEAKVPHNASPPRYVAYGPLGSLPFDLRDSATVYYLPGTTGWGTTYGGRPTALWRPQVQASEAGPGAGTTQFGFQINWVGGMTVVVEACTNVANPIWLPVSTDTLAGGSSCFSDSKWANYPARFYRLRSP